MSLHLEFEPHSWYMGFAIKNNRQQGHDQSNLEGPLANDEGFKWSAYTANGMNYQIAEFHTDTLKQLKSQIKDYTVKEIKRIKRLYEATK